MCLVSGSIFIGVIGVGIFCMSARPVSYTHLDVYKRQIYLSLTLFSLFHHNKGWLVKKVLIYRFLPLLYGIRALIAILEAKHIVCSRNKQHSLLSIIRQKPVSYTHLDVYKRQMYYEAYEE